MPKQDFGPIYHETDFSSFPVEPWSSFSNILFLIILVYWVYKIWPEIKRHTFIAFCLPFLGVGFVGGTVYHLTRSHPVWLFMDFMPILFLCLCAAAYFWRKINTSWVVIGLIIAGTFALVEAIHTLPALSQDLRINLGYTVFVIPIILPVIYYLFKTRVNWQYVLGALLCFSLAILFRYLDQQILPQFLFMGTHWLWHVFGAVSVHFLITFIYLDDMQKAGSGD